MNKHEREHRPRGLRKSAKPGGEERMRFAGIDIGGERHAVAVVNDNATLIVKSTLFGEEAVGYQLPLLKTAKTLKSLEFWDSPP
jgi:hypothetical protein